MNNNIQWVITIIIMGSFYCAMAESSEFSKLSLQGLRAYQNYNIQEAIQFNKSALKIAVNPDQTLLANVKLAHCYFEIDNYSKAMQMLMSADSLSNNTSIMYLRGLIYNRLDQPEGTKKELMNIEQYIQEKQVSGRKVIPLIFLRKALLQYELGQVSEALTSIDIAGKQGDGPYQITKVKTIILYTLEEYEMALKTLREIYFSGREVRKDTVEYLLWEAILLYNTDKMEEAITKYELALTYKKELPSKDVALKDYLALRELYANLPIKIDEDLKAIKKLSNIQK